MLQVIVPLFCKFLGKYLLFTTETENKKNFLYITYLPNPQYYSQSHPKCSIKLHKQYSFNYRQAYSDTSTYVNRFFTQIL